MISRLTVSPLWAGLLLFLGSPAHAFEDADSLSVRVDGELVTLTAAGVPLRDVVDALAEQFGLRQVRHADLDEPVELVYADEPLPDVLRDILRGTSYQLYLAVADDPDAVPGTLWIFPEGSARAPAATVFLETVLYRGSPRERRAAIRELGRQASPAAVRALSLALADSNERVRGDALQTLERIGTDEAVAAIASVGLDSDPRVRAEAVSVLAPGNGEAATRYLAMALDDPDPRVRMAALEALADIPPNRLPDRLVIDALDRGLDDPDADVRIQAIESLEEIGGDVAYRALLRMRSDGDPDVADSARESLSSMQIERTAN